MTSHKEIEKQYLASSDEAVAATGAAVPDAGEARLERRGADTDPAADGIVFVPAEQVMLHRVDLPLRSARQRRAALPFALEDALGAALEDVHVVALQSDRDGSILAAAVSKEVMADLAARRPDRPIVPEQMRLAVPEPQGARPCWAVTRRGARILVRVSDGSGFAVRADMLGPLWQRAGRPAVIALGPGLPDGIEAAAAPARPAPGAASLAAFDLRQGAFRPPLGLARPARWLAASLALGLAGHLGLAFADLDARAAFAETLRLDAARALEARLPEASVEAAPALLQRRIAAASAPRVGSGFLQLLDRVSQAWIEDGAPVQLDELAWSGTALRLVVEAPDLEALQRAEASLAGRGLSVSSGAATAEGGAARAAFEVAP